MLGNLISAGASLLGGIMGNKQKEKQDAANVQLQKDFAQQGIQWKVADAKAAGIHPLFALGANTHSFAPNSTGDSLGPALSSAGQNIGRAISSTSTGTQKVTAISKAAEALTLERGALENQLLRSQIARLNQQNQPSVPLPGTAHLIPGQGETTIPNVPGTLIDKPFERTGASPTNPVAEAATTPDIGYARNTYGHYPIPAKDIKEKIEDNLPHEVMHFIRNNIAPMAGYNKNPPDVPLQPGMVWSYSPIWGYYQRPLYNKQQQEKFFGNERR